MRENDRYLCVKEDAKTIVPETHPEAHIQVFRPGKPISDKDELRYDWSELDVEAVEEADVRVAAIEQAPRTTAIKRAPRRR